MVKGSTRRIVEIKDTGSSYFERAIFFVRSDPSVRVSAETLDREAAKVIDRFRAEAAPRRRGRKLTGAFRLMLSAAAGAALCLIALAALSLV